ncbi:MAG: LPS export ABC transporter permease LptG [Desulfuromonadaceae bacterium]|nr:LPS export ABC transporter permease LptG [Desulfuromonadaceae bacterium]MDD2856008.1 LPS export ABC transporter permease LptG [Desulfuromonadaceae bacterium]
MKVLDRYIAIRWLNMLLLCLSGFVGLYLVVDLIEKIPRFLRSGGVAVDILEYFICKFPEMISRTAIFSTLMATLLTLGALSRDSEIIAMRSCGISLFRLSMPMLILGFIASIVLFVNSELVLPHSYARTEMIDRVKIKKHGERVAFKRNNIWFRSDSMILQATMFEPKTKTLSGVVLWDVDSTMHPVGRVDADNAVYSNGMWLLNSVKQKKFNPSGFTEKSLETMPLDLKLKVEDLRLLDSDADNMSIRTLREYAENLRRGGYQAYRYLTLMHTKIASPFGALIMVLLGIPFALRNSRSGGIAMGIGVGIGLGFAYFVVNALLLSYGRSGALPPMAAAWGANIIFLLGGVWLSMRVRG